LTAVILDDPANLELKKKYERFERKHENSPERSKRSKFVAILQLLMAKCHQQAETLKGFSAGGVTYNELANSIDGFLGGRTLKAMINV